MDIYEFTAKLRSALNERGVSPEDADKYIERLKKYLTPEDTENATDAEINESADICVNLLKKKSADAASAPERTTDIDGEATAEYKISDTFKSRTEDEPSDEADPEKDEHVNHGFSPIPDAGMYGERKATPRGILMLTLITVVSSPLWLLAGVLFFTPFIVMIALEVAFTALFIGLLAGGSAAGAAASLTGIVYGIVSVFSTPAVGIYEIGFGVIIIGVAMIFGILSYNGAVRLMPWVFKKTGVFFRFALSKVKPFLSEYKRRCEKL